MFAPVDCLPRGAPVRTDLLAQAGKDRIMIFDRFQISQNFDVKWTVCVCRRHSAWVRLVSGDSPAALDTYWYSVLVYQPICMGEVADFWYVPGNLYRLS